MRDTIGHVRHEATLQPPGDPRPSEVTFRQLVARVSWSNPALASASQVGLVNNLNDGVAWGLFPLFFGPAGLSVARTGVLAFIYRAAWGIPQTWPGRRSERGGGRRLIVGGWEVRVAVLPAVVE